MPERYGYKAYKVFFGRGERPQIVPKNIESWRFIDALAPSFSRPARAASAREV